MIHREPKEERNRISSSRYMGKIDTKAKHRRPVSESAVPSRGQRKRALKKASLIKKIGLNSKHVRQRTDEDDKRVLSVAADEKGISSRPSLAAKASAFQRVSSNKGKRSLMTSEMGQINAVLSAPSFQQDPFAAIQAHLRQTALLTPPIADCKARRKPGKGKVSAKSIGQHAGETRGDRKPKVKPYKARNAKMRSR
ncbi:unnamed protein product [Ectocarpus sp. 4 AP-2014]